MTLPTPPTLDGVEWRPATAGDAGIISELQQRCFEVDGGYRVTAEEFRNELEDPDNSVAEDSLLAVDEAGSAVAFVYVQMPSGFETELRIFEWDFVRPDRRGAGIEDFVLDWYEARGRERAETIDAQMPRLLRASAYDWNQNRIDRLERRAFARIRYFVELARDLRWPVDERPLPAGYHVEPWPDDSEQVRLLHNEAFRDHWGTQPRSSDEWQRYDLDEFLRQDLSFIVTGGGVPVAYLRSTVYPHDFEDRDRTEAWVETLGTARNHRRRGLASALIMRALREYRVDGFDVAAIVVDSESPTGALRLYESLGFEVERRSISFGKPL